MAGESRGNRLGAGGAPPGGAGVYPVSLNDGRRRKSWRTLAYATIAAGAFMICFGLFGWAEEFLRIPQAGHNLGFATLVAICGVALAAVYGPRLIADPIEFVSIRDDGFVLLSGERQIRRVMWGSKGSSVTLSDYRDSGLGESSIPILLYIAHRGWGVSPASFAALKSSATSAGLKVIETSKKLDNGGVIRHVSFRRGPD